MPQPRPPAAPPKSCTDCGHSTVIDGVLVYFAVTSPAVFDWRRKASWDEESFPLATPGPCPGWTDAAGSDQ
jgi:hypothetical protein